MKGQFVNNYSEGICTITYSDGSIFNGNLVKGVPSGEGTLTKNGFIYRGNFEEGLREGEGQLAVQNSTFTLNSTFSKDRPAYECNRLTSEILGPKLEEVAVDPKAKPVKDAPKPVSKFSEQEDAKYGANKIFYEYKRPVPSAEEGVEETQGLEPEILI